MFGILVVFSEYYLLETVRDKEILLITPNVPVGLVY